MRDVPYRLQGARPLTDEQLDEIAPASPGVIQCDQHRRDDNEKRAQERIDAHYRLVLRFIPFIWHEDQRLDPVEMMESVAGRLTYAAQEERERRSAQQTV